MTREGQLILEDLELECTFIRSRKENQKFSRTDEVARESVILQMVTGSSYHDLVVTCTLAAVNHEFQDIFAVRIALIYALYVVEEKTIAGFIIAQTELGGLPVFVFLVLVRRDVDAEEACIEGIFVGELYEVL
jgi:hypothetical protein